MAPTVSVIVPVYNVADYLPQCIDSIVRQTYTRLEVLLVDDGSTDSSGDICDQWAARDARIRVIHKLNGGLSDARNAALDVMTGQMVMMVDGDDYVSDDCVETLVKLMDDTQCDVAIGQWCMFDDNNQPRSSSHSDNIQVFDREQAIKRVFYQDTLTNSACSRMFKATVFDNLRVPVGMLYEDLAVVYPLLMSVRTVTYTSHIVYYYRQRQASITGHFTDQRTQVLDILEDLEHQVASHDVQFLPAVQSRLLSAYFNILLLAPDDSRYRAVIDRCWEGVCRLRCACMVDGNVRLKNRLGIMASLLGKTLFRHLFSGKMLKKY